MTDPDSVALRSIAVQESPEFQHLRRSFIGFIAPMTVLFLAWYLLYIILAGFAPGFFAIKVFGLINVGLLFGLAQVVTTFAITMIYRNWADRRYDPAAAELREEMETGEVGGAEAVAHVREQYAAGHDGADLPLPGSSETGPLSSVQVANAVPLDSRFSEEERRTHRSESEQPTSHDPRRADGTDADEESSR